MANTVESSAGVQRGTGFRVAEGSVDGLGVAAANADSNTDSGATLVRYGFRAGHLNLLVPEGVATEVLDQPVVYPLPRGPRWLAGLINQRGTVIPLFDLFELSGASGKPSQVRRVLLLGHSAHAVAIYIDELPTPLTATDRAAVAASLPGILQPFVEPAFFAQDSHWYEFEYIRFFSYLAAEVQGEADALE